MTDTIVRPLTSDNQHDVNPWASPEVKAALRALNEKRAEGWRPAERTDWGAKPGTQDFLGRPITAEPATIHNSGLPADVVKACEMNAAYTKAWLKEHKDGAEEPTGIDIPPVVHDRPATPDEQAWLDAHPEYAIQPGQETETYTYVPFGSAIGKAQPKMMTPPEPVSEEVCAAIRAADIARVSADLRAQEHKVNLDTRRHMDTKQGYPANQPAKLEGRNQVAHNTCTQVRWFWSDALGTPNGYDLFLGHNWVHFPGPEWRIEEVLNPPLASKDERREVNWDIEWNAPGGRASLINLEDKGVAKKPIEQQIDEQHAEAVATRPASEWETFDKEDDALKPPAEAEKPTYLGHTAVPDEAIHAIPNHIKRELSLAPEKVGLHVRNALGTATPDYIGKHGVREAWDKALDYVAKVKANQNSKDKEPDEQTAPTSPAKADTTKGNTEMQQTTKTERSSATETTNVDAAAKRDEIRNKFTMDMRGKEYLVVQGRVSLFRLEHPDWTIETDVIALTDNAAVFKATIKNAEGRVIATGHGRATDSGTKNLGGRYIEKSETAAIGRALALAGFGSDDTLDDRDYLSDSPIAKAA